MWRWCMVLTAVCVSGVGARGPLRADQPATAAVSATAPADPGWGTPVPGQTPAQRILVRVGDRGVITQRDFEQELSDVDPRYYDMVRDGLLRGLVEQRLFAAYVRDHPELVPEKAVDDYIDRQMRLSGLSSFDEVMERLRLAEFTMEELRESIRVALARAALSDQGEAVINDEAALRDIYDRRTDEFNGTAVRARQLMYLVAPYETPEEREIKRRKLAAMLEDLRAGRRTWEECVAETDSRDRDGTLDAFTRHLMINPVLAAAAFALKPGEYSEVIETLLGLHVIHVQERIPGTRPFEDVIRNMRRWLINEPYTLAIMEAMRRYPVVGVQPPLKPTGPIESAQERLQKLIRSGQLGGRGSTPATRPTTQPASPAGTAPAAVPARPGG